MEKFLSKYAPYLYALMRMVAGLMFAMHGSQKLLGWPGDRPALPLASQMGVAGVIELVGGLMIAIGLFTSIAAFVASGLMVAAYILAHAPRGTFPLLNQGELAALYCFVFLYIASRGSGMLSVDSTLRRKSVKAFR